MNELENMIKKSPFSKKDFTKAKEVDFLGFDSVFNVDFVNDRKIKELDKLDSSFDLRGRGKLDNASN